MSEIKGFPTKIQDQQSRHNQPKVNKNNNMKDDFNSALIENLEHLKSIENKIDNLDNHSDKSTPSSLDDNVKNAGVILKDIEGLWENLKDKNPRET